MAQATSHMEDTPFEKSPRARLGMTPYSRFVKSMKLFLPFLALILIALVLIWPQLSTQDHRFMIGFSGIEAREAADLNMVNARYTGMDNNNLPFSVTADIAKNLSPDAMEVELEMPKADMTLDDGSWLVLTAEEGKYQQEQQKLDLKGAVNLYHDSGYEIRTAKADVDLSKGEASSDVKVKGHGPFGQLESEGFLLKDLGERIIFTGKAHLLIYPGVGDAK
ncbi:MAG: LPS export ABC transporter periplasmic protein LptC [Rhodospirillales bacterium]|nr:LPS export ABC transporter periplasmic protein LptC [Rhodospirillales bacterium]